MGVCDKNRNHGVWRSRFRYVKKRIKKTPQSCDHGAALGKQEIGESNPNGKPLSLAIALLTPFIVAKKPTVRQNNSKNQGFPHTP